MKFAVCVIQI